MDRQLHYHIRWSRVLALDWECFSTFDEAEARAKELVRLDETYKIEEHDEACPRCRAAMNLKTSHDAESEAASNLKYSWQQAVLAAFNESRPELLRFKVNLAQRAISTRLVDKTPLDNDESIAIREALRSLQALLPEPRREDESGQKKATA